MSKKRLDVCIDCGEYDHIVGRDRCGKCYRKWYRQQPHVKERHSRQERERRANHPERYKEYYERRKKTKRRIEWKREYHKKYYDENSEQLKAYQVQWRKDNPEQFKSYWQASYARKKNAEGRYTTEQWNTIVNFYCPDNKCPSCGNVFVDDIINRKLSVDHVIPLTLGGTNWPENLQPLCYSCNCSKGNHSCTDYRFDSGEFAKGLQE